jgi:hypothetical protein
MAGIFDGSNLTLNREDIKNMSEAIWEAFYLKPSINEFHTIETGIVHNKQIAILGIFEGLTGQLYEECGLTPNTSQVGASEKEWNPKRIGDRFEQCFSDLLDTFWKYSLKPGVKKDDLTATDFARFIEERISDAIAEGVFRHVWFGDTDAANYNSSPAGHILNGTALKWFNVIDGYWKQVYDIVAADSDRKSVYVAGDSSSIATKNAQSTYANQRFNATDTTNELITNSLQKIIDDADTRLVSGTETPHFIVTKSVADQYKRERKKASGIDLAYERVEKGIMKLQCDGFDLYVFDFMDRMIKSYENNGTKWYLPHRILFTTKSNLRVGTEEESNLSTLKMFYAEYQNKYVIEYAFNLDAKVILDDQIQVAY